MVGVGILEGSEQKRGSIFEKRRLGDKGGADCGQEMSALGPTDAFQVHRPQAKSGVSFLSARRIFRVVTQQAPPGLGMRARGPRHADRS